jgi:hypothetical protein
VGEQELLLLRLMTPVAKFYTGKMAVATISEVQDIKTGFNQLDNPIRSNQGIKKSHRSALVLSDQGVIEIKFTEIIIFHFSPNTFKYLFDYRTYVLEPSNGTFVGLGMLRRPRIHRRHGLALHAQVDQDQNFFTFYA